MTNHNITQTRNDGNYRIYCDMDGVLCNFWPVILDLMNSYIGQPTIINPDIAKKANIAISIINQIHGRDYFILTDIMKEHKAPKEVRNYMYSIISNNQKIWEDLDWTCDGRILWKKIRPYNPIILSSPVDSDSVVGKQNWIKKNLGNYNSIFERDKFLFAGPKNILIDDYDFNIENWKNHNGIGILHIEIFTTMRQLNEILNIPII